MPELLHGPPRAPASAGPAPAAVKPPPSADRRVAKRREARAFRVAMAVVALALIDDAFVHPEPGTSAGDHLAVIAVPGRSGPGPHARMLARHGYGVLLFDRRGEGDSDGDFNAFGWGGDADIKAAITFLAQRPDVDATRIGGLGLSVGGEMMLETAAEDARLRAVVSEGAGVRSLAEHWDDPAPAAAQKPFSDWVIQTQALTVLANQPPPPSLSGLVADIAPRPLLLIRGLDGQQQETLNRAYYDAAQQPKALWEVPGAGHAAALAAQPHEYERRVIGFLDRALLARNPRPQATEGKLSSEPAS